MSRNVMPCQAVMTAADEAELDAVQERMEEASLLEWRRRAMSRAERHAFSRAKPGAGQRLGKPAGR